MSRPIHRTLALVLAGPLLLGVSLGVRAQTSAAAPALVQTTTAQILEDIRGKTLYLYTRDRGNKSVCYGDCAVDWPPVLVPHGVAVPPALPGVSGQFGVIGRSGGQRQLTYDGAPLYTFAADKKAGEMTGQGAGGVWWVVVVSPAATAPAGSTEATATPSAGTGSYYGGTGSDDNNKHTGQRGGSSTPVATATASAGGSYYGGQGDGRHGGDG